MITTSLTSNDALTDTVSPTSEVFRLSADIIDTISHLLRDAAAASPEPSLYAYAYAGAALALAVLVAAAALTGFVRATRARAVINDPNDPAGVIVLRQLERYEAAPALAGGLTAAAGLTCASYLFVNLPRLLFTMAAVADMVNRAHAHA